MQACDRTPLVLRLSVDDPDALRGDAWRGHLAACQVCRREFEGLEHSLALYRALEAERLEQMPAAPSWERFSRRLRARTVIARRMRTVRVPLAAAAAGLLLLAGAVSWSVLEGRLAQRVMFPLAGQATPSMVREPAQGHADAAVQVVVDPTAFNRPPSASARLLRESRLEQAVDKRIATRGDRRTTQFPWVGAHTTSDGDLLTRQFMRGDDAADSALLAPLTPLRSGGNGGINFASYAGAQRR